MKVPPAAFSVEERVAMGTRCRDCDSVPKVADAGQVFETADGTRVQIMHNGLKVLADGYYGEWMTNLIRLCRGHHETQEEKLFHEIMKHIPANARMIELGGFWAYYSMWFLMNHPDRQVVVIEPDPTHLAVGQANAAMNGVTPLFKQGFAGYSYEEALPFQCEVAGEQMIPRYSVRRLMDEQGWLTIDLLHCDIQGAETDVLESCREMFMNGQIKWLFVSTHTHWISGDPLTHQRCLAILRECGATIEAEHDVHESFSGDGLIVARFGAAPPGWEPVEISSNRASQSLFRHLAWDLDESRRETEALRSLLVPAHPALRSSGSLITLAEDGALGPKGSTLLLPDDDIISPHVKGHAGWDLQNLADFLEHVVPERAYTLVDIGANIGLFSRQVALAVPGIEQLHCVEPEPANFNALRYNLSLLTAPVAFHNFALGAVDGDASLLRDAQNIGNYSLNPDAMRDRPHDAVSVATRATAAWMREHLAGSGAILWKSDTQGSDELIVAQTPIDIWRRIDVAMLEMWRIAKPDYDRAAFRERIEDFPNRQLGDECGVSAQDVIDYLDGDDWRFKDLLMWR